MGWFKQRADLQPVLDKRTQNSTVNKERTIINLKNSLQETRGCCSAAGSFVLLTVFHPFFFFSPFLVSRTNTGAVGGSGASLGIALILSRARSCGTAGTACSLLAAPGT